MAKNFLLLCLCIISFALSSCSEMFNYIVASLPGDAEQTEMVERVSDGAQTITLFLDDNGALYCFEAQDYGTIKYIDTENKANVITYLEMQQLQYGAGMQIIVKNTPKVAEINIDNLLKTLSWSGFKRYMMVEPSEDEITYINSLYKQNK